MCDGRIHRTQRFPANPANGQVPVWNALTKKWEAQNQSGGGSLPSGSNPNDMLYWDATNEEWIVGAEVSGFNPSSDYSISGQFDYSNGLILSATDPSSAFSPITGVSIFADTSNNFSVKRADGIRYSFSSAFLSTDRKFTFPNRDGKFAMSDFDNEFTATQTFTQINNGRAGFPGKINWYNDSGSLVAASGIVPGASNFFHEGNNFNFRTNATGFFFGSGSTWVTPTARLHVRGDGTNAIFRAEDNSGTANFQIFNNYTLIGGSTPFGPYMYAMTGTTFTGTNNGVSLGFYNRNTTATTTSSYDIGFGGDAIAATAGNRSHLALVRTFAAGTGSANFRPLEIAYTINNSGAQTGAATGIFLNATETALNGMAHNLMDLQVCNATTFKIISRTFGGVPSNPSLELSGTTGAYFQLNRGGSMNWYVQASSGKTDYSQASGKHNFQGTANTMITLGDVTNAFPALRRSGAVLEVRLADDSDFARIRSSNIIVETYIGNITSGIVQVGSAGSASANAYFNSITESFSFGVASAHASAKLQIDSTTKGFLLPRMTSAQRDAIAAPAEGLEIYNTTEKAKQVWNGIAWKTILTA